MMWFRTYVLVTMVAFASACSVATKDPWGWLEEPAEQTWKEASFNAIGREVEFSVPDLEKNLGSHVKVWPENGVNEASHRFSFPLDRLYEPYTLVATFTWDSWWGGFYKKGGEDFYLSVGIHLLDSDDSLLDLDLNQRVQWTSDYWLSLISKPDSEKREFKEYFTKNLKVEPFVNEKGLAFVEHNAPRVSGEHQEYTIPISDHHILEFSFYVNKLRHDTKEDPEWNQSRWELVEKIMKTVRITPDPFGNQPEEIPPH